jgi:hypothetical protein
VTGALAEVTLVARAPIAAPIPKNASALTAVATARERVVATFLRGRGVGVVAAVIAGLLRAGSRSVGGYMTK